MKIFVIKALKTIYIPSDVLRLGGYTRELPTDQIGLVHEDFVLPEDSFEILKKISHKSFALKDQVEVATKEPDVDLDVEQDEDLDDEELESEDDLSEIDSEVDDRSEIDDLEDL